jgi:hypothetical protein
MSKLIDMAGVMSTKVTHIFRGCGARFLFNSGLAPEAIAALGLWEGFTRLERNYLSTALPLLAMLIAAGLSEKDLWKAMKLYSIPRASLPVPPALKAKIFPWLDRWLQLQREQQAPGAGTQLPMPLTTVYILKLLDWLREVLIQVSSPHNDRRERHPPPCHHQHHHSSAQPYRVRV